MERGPGGQGRSRGGARIAGGLGALEAAAAVVACAALLWAAMPAQAWAVVPQTLAVEGTLRATGGGAVADGSYTMKFALYGQQTGGKALWSEGPISVKVTAGRFSLALGTMTPLGGELLDGVAMPWLGVTVAGEPELPRAPLHAVVWALRAAGLSCSGCVKGAQLAGGAVTADKLAFTFAGAKTKGGPATQAMDLSCTGCVSVDEMKFDKDLDLGGIALKVKKITAVDIAAQNVSATSFVGDGSKLTGIQIPSGTCPGAGEVVRGIDPSGKLLCTKVHPTLPPDGLDEVSNGLLYNQFDDEVASKTTPLKIKDNDPTGASDSLDFPDIGLAQKLEVKIDLVNSDLSTLEVKLYDPNNVAYVLWKQGAKGTALKTTYPTLTKPLTGDLGAWIGKNPKGKWRIMVVDTGKLNGAFDGAIKSWSVLVHTLSNKKIQLKGDLYVDGKVQAGQLVGQGSFNATAGLFVQKAATPPAKCDASQEARVYFDTKKRRFYGCTGKAWVRMDNGISGDIMNKLYTLTSDSKTGGNTWYAVDKVNITSNGQWTSHCIQTSGSGAHWLKVDFGQQMIVERFAVQGYPGGSHKPSTTWYLQGSNNNNNWTTVWSGGPAFWITGPGTYPPKKIITVSQPGPYRWYRLYGSKWTNGYMLVCNWAMYE